MASTTPRSRHAKPSRGTFANLNPLFRLTILEFLITAAMLFLIASSVRLVFYPGSALSSVLTGQTAMTAFGIVFGIVTGVIVHFSMTWQTAGHMNPSVSIGLWLLRVFPGKNVLPFCAAQLFGSVAGVALAGLLWGDAMGSPSVRHAAVGPAPGWSFSGVLAAETGAQLACMTVVAALLLRPRLTWLISIVVGVSVCLFIAILGPLSGGSVNPARQFGPALLSGHTAFLGAYLIGPVLGAALAAGLAAALRTPAVVPPSPGVTVSVPMSGAMSGAVPGSDFRTEDIFADEVFLSEAHRELFPVPDNCRV